MIKFSTKRWGEVEVRFEYNFPFMTYASMTYKDGDERVVVAGGYAQCHEGDLWDKKIGRKYAFTRLLEDAVLDREDRTSAWDAFKALCKI